MAVITDLTWAQLEAASGAANLIEVHQTEGLKLRLSVMLAAIVTDKNTTGVVKALNFLREYAAKAQVTVNTNQQIGERLAAFPPASSGAAVDGYVLTSGQILVKQPLNAAGTIGASN